MASLPGNMFTAHVELGQSVYIGDDEVVVAKVIAILFEGTGYSVRVCYWNGRSLEDRYVPSTLVRPKEG